jgi:hypothetical protein
MNYQVNDSIYTGSELENGVTLRIYPADLNYYSSISISLSRANSWTSILFATSEDGYRSDFMFVDNEDVKDFVPVKK